MLNPEILEHSETTDKEEEWCLSVPGAKWKVERYLTIKLSYLDNKGKQKILRLNGLSARIVQHEIDHLDGKLMVDYLSPLKRNRIKSKLQKAQKKREG